MAHIIEDVDYYEYTHPRVNFPEEPTLQVAALLYSTEICIGIVCACGIVRRSFKILSGEVGRGSHEIRQRGKESI